MHRLYTALFWVLCATCYTATTMADTPVGPMNYQGRLLDDAGIPLTGNYNFVVKIYDDPVSGVLKYQESHSALSVDDGVYAFKVGTGTSVTGNWDIDLWQGNLNDLYLELVVNGETLTPRHELTSAPHAFTATLALSAGALGNKTAAQFDNILEGVCVASKGVWLEKVGKCLGAGASFPGPTLVALSSLTDKTDLNSLDLTGADISGIDLSGSNLRYTIFKNTIYQVAGLSGADLRDTQWEAAIATDASAQLLGSGTNLSGATFKNMAMARWNLSAITSEYMLQYFSAAYLTSCPAAVFGWSYSPWECRLMKAGGDRYFMVGGYANLSTTSAAATTSLGESYLDVDANALDDANLDYASLVGNVIRQNLQNARLYGADLSYTAIRDVHFQGADTWIAGTKFISAKLERVTFDADVFMSSPDFSKADLRQVRFLVPAAGQNFTGASLYEVDFSQVAGLTNFTDATFNNVSIDYLVGNTTPWESVFRRVKIYGQFHVRDIADGALNEIIFEDLSFIRATWSGDFRGAIFLGTTTFRDTRFENLNLCGATIPLVDTDVPYDELARVSFRTTLCPNNYVGGCNTNASPTPMTPIADINQCYKLGIPDANGDGTVDP